MKRLFDDRGQLDDLQVADDAEWLVALLEDFARVRGIGAPSRVHEWCDALRLMARNRAMTGERHERNAVTCGLTGERHGWLSVPEVSVMLRMSESSALRFARKHGEKSGGRWRVRSTEVEQWERTKRRLEVSA